MAALKESQVLAIRARLTNGERQTDLAREYGVSVHVIFRIKHGIAYNHI